MAARTFESRTTDPPQSVPPRFRGVAHVGALFVAVPVGVLLVLHAPSGVGQVGAAIFAASVAFMHGSSTLFHRRRWAPERMRWIGLLDHAAIYVLIAGTYTPIALFVIHPGWRLPILAVVWVGALAATLRRLFRPHAPPWVAAATCLAFGWVSVIVMPQIVERIGLGPASCSWPAGSPTPSARSSTRGGSPILSPTPSATTRSSTLSSSWPSHASTRRSRSSCSRTHDGAHITIVSADRSSVGAVLFASSPARALGQLRVQARPPAFSSARSTSREQRLPGLGRGLQGGAVGAWPMATVRPRTRPPWPAVMFVNGATPDGRAHPGVRRFAASLARAGYIVFIPELPGVAAGELSLLTLAASIECAVRAADSAETRNGRIGLFGVSVGGTLALLTGASPTSRLESRSSPASLLSPTSRR